MSCRRICGGAGGARHAGARPSISDLASPVTAREAWEERHNLCPRRLDALCTSSSKCTRGRARVDRGARAARACCAALPSCLVVARAPSLSARVPACVAPLHPSRLRMVHCSPPSMLPVRACSRAACECDSRLASRDCGAVAILARAARRSLCMWRSAVLFPPLWKLPAHCMCALPSGAKSNNVDLWQQR